MRSLIFLTIFAGLLISGYSHAESYPPSPSPPIVSQPQQTKTENHQAKTDYNHRGSDDFPVSVKIIGPIPTKTEINNITNKTDDKSSTDGLLIFFNFLLAIFTGALAWYTSRLNRSTEKLWKTSNDQIQLSNASLELARQEFVSSHRPTIVVKNFRLVTEKPEIPIKILVDITNKGATPAKNITIYADIGFKKDGQWVRPIDIMTKEVKKFDCIAAGEFLPDIAIESYRIHDQQASTDFFWDEQFTLIIAGRIEYRDKNNVLRRTGFMRSLPKSNGRFIASNDPDEEYQD